jgi:polar amino acid transport system substrate-binding protein
MAGKILNPSIALFVLMAFPFVVLGYDLKTVAQNSSPKYYFTENDEKRKMAGLCIDIMQAIEKVAPEIEFVGADKFTPTARIFKYLETGKIDVYVGAARNKEREKISVYVDIPLYSVSHVVAVRMDDNVKVKSFRDIRALEERGVILTLFGTGTHKYLLQQHGLLIEARMTLSSLFDPMLYHRDKARPRFVYYHDLGLSYAIESQNLGKKVKLLPTKFRQYNHYIAFSKKVPPKIIAKVRAAVEQLVADGELARLHNKYR